MSVLWQVVGGVVVFLAVAGALWWWVPKWQMRSIVVGDQKARADIEDNFRKTVGQALGGLAVLLTGISAYLQFTQQQQTALQTSEISRKTAEDLRISNQVAKGFEQLAGEKTAMRLGGIYALEGVMNGSKQYGQPVLEALCAYVRDGTRKLDGKEPPTTDIQAVLTVIGRRDRSLEGVDLNFAVVPKADLSGANLSEVNLNSANLINAFLIDANLSSAYLNKANLSGTNLSAANLSDAALNSANLTDANLSGADLRGAKGLTQEQLDTACGTDARLPSGLTLKPC